MGERQTSGDDERRRREDALRVIAAQQSAAGATTVTAAPSRAQGSRQGSRRLPLLALLTLLLLGGGVFGWLRFSSVSHHPTSQRVALTFPDGALACASDVAWAPDSRRIAVLGRDTCGTNGPWDSLLRVYDATTGKQLLTADLGPIIQAHIVPHTVYPKLASDPALLSQVPALTYGLYGWSPDGGQVAMLVGVDTGAYRQIIGHPRISASDYWFALLLVNARDGSARAPGIAPASTTPGASPSNPAQPFDITRWDLTTGAQRTITLAPALAYTWSADGTLRPAIPLPGPTPATSHTTPAPPPGNPDGGQSFSMWQDIQAQYNADYCSGAFLWTLLRATAWSPDGRYLVAGINVQGRLIPPGAPPGGTASGNCLPASQEGTDPLSPRVLAALPIRDLGLRAALVAFLKQPDPSRAQLLARWDASGQRLVIQNVPQFAPATIAIYDTATGRLAKRYAVTAFDPHYDPSVSSLSAAWSPDGARLLLSDAHVLVVLSGAEVGA
ncbi:MAG TPA: hypothetical protein VFY89_02065 [Ktedonobacterales bacterium]